MIQLMHENMKPHNFRKKGNTWYRVMSGLTQIVNLQKSAYGDYYYINIGICIHDLSKSDYVPENQCDLRARANELLPDLSDKITELLQNSKSVADSKLRASLSCVIEDLIKLMDKCDSVNALREQLQQGNLGMMAITVKARKLLLE